MFIIIGMHYVLLFPQMIFFSTPYITSMKLIPWYIHLVHHYALMYFVCFVLFCISRLVSPVFPISLIIISTALSHSYHCPRARETLKTESYHHYTDVIMAMMVFQITSLTIAYSAVYSGADQRKHQSPESLAFVRGIHRRPVNSPHKWPVTRKMFPFDDIIMMMQALSSLVGQPAMPMPSKLAWWQLRLNFRWM